jgi:hypothetical protein
MLRYCRMHLCAIVALLVWTAAFHASGQKTPRTIHEGEGWDRFLVGANANSLIGTFGYPDKDSNGRMMKWDKLGFNCLLNDKNEAMELRFEKRSRAVTASGVTFGMSPDRVHKIYGDAGQMEWRGGGMKQIWPSRGILIWFRDNAVYQIVIFRPYT